MIYASSARMLPAESVGDLLFGRLLPFRKNETVLIAATSKCMPLARHLATRLNCQVTERYCKALQHPADSNRTIGSITSDEILLHDDAAGLPQGYIEHQVHMLKSIIHRQATVDTTALCCKNVAIIHHEILAADDVLALIRSINRQHPERILILTPVIRRKARLDLEAEVETVAYITQESDPIRWRKNTRRISSVLHEHLLARK